VPAWDLCLSGANKNRHRAGRHQRTSDTLPCLFVAAETISQDIKERTTDDRALIFIQFDCVLHLGDETQAMDDEDSIFALYPDLHLLLSRRIMAVEVNEMTTITLSDILDDLRVADQALRKLEQRYWISSADFYELYSQGRLDDGQHREDFSEWAGYYKLKLKRETALKQLSQQRLEHLRSQTTGETIDLLPEEPVLELA